MPRKSTKTAENTTQAIADALDTPLNLEWDTTAEKLMVSVPELQERMACKLDDTVFTWGTIPAEHQPVVGAVSRDLDAERSIRSFGEDSEPAAQLPPVADIPELPEELQLQNVDEHAGSNCRFKPFTRRVVSFPRFGFKEPTLEALGYPAFPLATLSENPTSALVESCPRCWLNRSVALSRRVVVPSGDRIYQGTATASNRSRVLVYRCRCPGRCRGVSLESSIVGWLVDTVAHGYKGTTQT